MNKKDMDSLLADAVADFCESQGIELPKGIIKSLPTESVYYETEAKEKDAFLDARNAFMKSGKVTLEDRESGLIEGFIYAGIANMNPAVLIIHVDGNTIRISSYAKEGIINQHTAEKAIEKFLNGEWVVKDK